METLTLDERERIVDSALKIQSVRNSLELVGETKIPCFREIAACLKSVDHNLRAALGYMRRLKPDTASERRRNTPSSGTDAADNSAQSEKNEAGEDTSFPAEKID